LVFLFGITRAQLVLDYTPDSDKLTILVSSAPEESPANVKVGVYVLNAGKLDISSGKFLAQQPNLELLLNFVMRICFMFGNWCFEFGRDCRDAGRVVEHLVQRTFIQLQTICLSTKGHTYHLK
jgi:hypothetical protein